MCFGTLNSCQFKRGEREASFKSLCVQLLIEYLWPFYFLSSSKLSPCLYANLFTMNSNGWYKLHVSVRLINGIGLFYFHRSLATTTDEESTLRPFSMKSSTLPATQMTSTSLMWQMRLRWRTSLMHLENASSAWKVLQTNKQTGKTNSLY